MSYKIFYKFNSVIKAMNKLIKNIFPKYLLCSNCFNNHGLKVNAFILGVSSKKACRNCNTTQGKKLCRSKIITLAYTFFVQGTQVKLDYGGAPLIQFNQSRHGSSDNDFPEAFKKDMSIILKKQKLVFFIMDTFMGCRYKSIFRKTARLN